MLCNASSRNRALLYVGMMTEKRIASLEGRKLVTLPSRGAIMQVRVIFNGYEQQVGQLYAGMDLKKNY
jgi:hypothetical protein